MKSTNELVMIAAAGGGLDLRKQKLAYHNMLRVQGWIGNLCLVVERQLFGQEPLNRYHGYAAGEQLTKEIARLEDVLMPLVERCQRMMARGLAHLEVRRQSYARCAVCAEAEMKRRLRRARKGRWP
jgi:hypothetical protein